MKVWLVDGWNTERVGRRLLGALLVCVFAVVAAMSTVDLAQAKKPKTGSAKPNIVLVQVDDAVRSDISYLPNVRQVIQRGGANFTNYNAPYPLCGPARASLLTGQLAHNNKMMGNFRESHGGHFVFRNLEGKLNQSNSLGPWMRKAGYRTALVGKYLNEYGVANQTEVPPGWDRWVAMLDNSTYDYFNYGLNVDGKLRFHGDEGYARQHIKLGTVGYARPQTSFAQLMKDFLTVYQPWDFFGTQFYRQYSATITGTYAVRFVRNQSKRKKPFFLYYAPPQPHAEDANHLQGIREGAPGPDPRPSKQFRDTYDQEPLIRTPSFNEADVSDKASNVSDLPLLTDDDIATIQDNYRGRLGALRQVDNQVGRIIKVLKKKGEFKNTYFIFVSDNGYLQGEHRLSASKFLPFENSVRIPAMIAGPGIKAGREVTRPAMDVDLTATLLDIAGAKSGRTPDGISLLKAAKGKQGLPERDIPLEALKPLFDYSTPLTAYDVPYYGVKTKNYKYVNWSFGDKELYDLKNDPDEMENLAGDPSKADLLAELEAEASRLRGCVGTSQCR